MSNLNTPASSVEETVSRAITDPTTTPFTTYSIRELKDMELVTTPLDVPLFTMLAPKAAKSANIMFEWIESALSTNYAGGKYAGYDISGVAAAGATPTTNSNYLMAYAQIARVGGLVESLDTVDGNAMLLETRHKYAQLIRGIEYYLWNGNHTSNADETNGLVTLVTTAVANGGGALLETSLQSAIVAAVNNGLMPDTVFCSPVVAQRIANFSEDRIRYNNTTNAEGGIGMSAFRYNSPFGYSINVVAVRTSFIPTGKVYVIDSSLVRMRYSGADVIQSQKLPESNDGSAILMKSYFGIEISQKADHIVITGLTESIT